MRIHKYDRTQKSKSELTQWCEAADTSCISTQPSKIIIHCIQHTRTMTSKQAFCWSTCLLTVFCTLNNVRLLTSIGDRHRQEALASALMENPMNVPTQTMESVVVDILSIGSQRRWDFLEMQRQTLGAHPNVRHFFNATELDDVDPHCDTVLTVDDLMRIRSFCHSRSGTTALLAKWKRYFAPSSILKHKRNPVGWLCAQTRPAVGLHRVLTHYQNTREAFPDYLIVQDDDTYWNLDRLIGILEKKAGIEQPQAWVGCIFRLPHLWVPHGGFGLVLNRALLDKLTSRRPLHSYDDSDHSSDDLLVGGQSWVQRNSTLIDSIYAHVTAQPFTKYKNWDEGFCVHSDW